MALLIINEHTKHTDLPEDLRPVFAAYLKAISKRSEFERLRVKYVGHRISDEGYNRACRQLAAGVKYICYRKDSQRFEVKPRIAGKVVNVATVDDFDLACSTLQEYLEIKANEK